MILTHNEKELLNDHNEWFKNEDKVQLILSESERWVDLIVNDNEPVIRWMHLFDLDSNFPQVYRLLLEEEGSK